MSDHVSERSPSPKYCTYYILTQPPAARPATTAAHGQRNTVHPRHHLGPIPDVTKVPNITVCSLEDHHRPRPPLCVRKRPLNLERPHGFVWVALGGIIVEAEVNHQWPLQWPTVPVEGNEHPPRWFRYIRENKWRPAPVSRDGSLEGHFGEGDMVCGSSTIVQ